ncbi:hypothetical protein BGW39_003189 [Mortierella sp. 14UC]|nr:hypothetical protein BGW39_003189 [Mortierella sp. 14UC]
MKLVFFLGALAVTAVSALPTGIFDVPAPETTSQPLLIPEPENLFQPTCRTVNLKWRVRDKFENKYFNTFTIEIKYPNGGTPDYRAIMDIEQVALSGEKSACWTDGVWCVKFSDRDQSESLTLQYAGLDFVHDTPQLRSSYIGYSREEYEYIDCV